MGSWGLSAPGAENVEKESKKSPKLTFFGPFGLFFDSFWTFSTPGAESRREAPGTHFRTFFGLWARRAQMTPVAGEEDSNLWEGLWEDL